MNKLNRRDFLKQIGSIPFMAIPLARVLGAEEKSGTVFIEAYTDENDHAIGWDVDPHNLTVNGPAFGVRLDESGSPKYFRID